MTALDAHPQPAQEPVVRVESIASPVSLKVFKRELEMLILPQRELRQIGTTNAIFALAQVLFGVSSGVWIAALVTLRTVALSAENRAIFLAAEYGAGVLSLFFLAVTALGIYNGWRTIDQIMKEHKTSVTWETVLRETASLPK